MSGGASTKKRAKSPMLLLDEYPLIILPSLAKRVGLNKAVVLQQVHYRLQTWEGKTHEGRKWVYNSYPEWQKKDFPFWSLITIKRTFLSLEQDGLLISAKLNHIKQDQTKWYTIDYQKLEESELPPHDGGDNGDPGDEHPSYQIDTIKGSNCYHDDGIKLIPSGDQFDTLLHYTETLSGDRDNHSEMGGGDLDRNMKKEGLLPQHPTKSPIPEHPTEEEDITRKEAELTFPNGVNQHGAEWLSREAIKDKLGDPPPVSKEWKGELTKMLSGICVKFSPWADDLTDFVRHESAKGTPLTTICASLSKLDNAEDVRHPVGLLKHFLHEIIKQDETSRGINAAIRDNGEKFFAKALAWERKRESGPKVSPLLAMVADQINQRTELVLSGVRND